MDSSVPPEEDKYIQLHCDPYSLSSGHSESSTIISKIFKYIVILIPKKNQSICNGVLFHSA